MSWTWDTTSLTFDQTCWTFDGTNTCFPEAPPAAGGGDGGAERRPRKGRKRRKDDNNQIGVEAWARLSPEYRTPERPQEAPPAAPAPQAPEPVFTRQETVQIRLAEFLVVPGQDYSWLDERIALARRQNAERALQAQLAEEELVVAIAAAALLM